MKKTPRSVQITAINHGDERRVRAVTQRNNSADAFSDDAQTTVHEYYIRTRLRMSRCLFLQSAFLAKDGAVMK